MESTDAIGAGGLRRAGSFSAATGSKGGVENFPDRAAEN
jgi:hypothetical protein